MSLRTKIFIFYGKLLKRSQRKIVRKKTGKSHVSRSYHFQRETNIFHLPSHLVLEHICRLGITTVFAFLQTKTIFIMVFETLLPFYHIPYIWTLIYLSIFVLFIRDYYVFLKLNAILWIKIKSIWYTKLYTYLNNRYILHKVKISHSNIVCWIFVWFYARFV